MYIIDGIAYAGEPAAAIKVISVRALDDYTLWLRFSTGETKVFDFKPLLNAPCFIPLKDEAIFKQAYVDYGVVVWNDDEIDIAPEKLYNDGVVTSKENIAILQADE